MFRLQARGWLLVVLIALLSWCVSPGIGGAAIGIKKSKGQTVYAPAYSFVYYGDKARTFNLTTTLAIRNTDATHAIVLTSVDYYDSNGKLVKNYLKSPLEIPPLASTSYLVEESDVRGGATPSFIVMWKTATEVIAPLIETIMIGAASMQGISFVSPSRVIKESTP